MKLPAPALPRIVFLLSGGIFFGLIVPSQAWAYIGPGAGFAFLGSFFIFFITFLISVAALFAWPVRYLLRLRQGQSTHIKNPKIKKAIVVGFDGMEPTLVERYMNQGLLPHFSRLRSDGIFSMILRVPITFPPERFNGLSLPAMWVPDLRGTQGTFSYYTTRPEEEKDRTGGEVIPVQWKSVKSGRKGFAHALFHPAADPLSDHNSVSSVEIDYPRQDFLFRGHKIHWIWPFFLVTMAVGFLLRGFFRVRF